MLHQHLCHGVLPSLTSTVEPLLSHFNTCTMDAVVNGCDSLFLFSPLLVNGVMLWVRVQAERGVGDREKKEGRKKRGGINKTEAGNDELRKRPLIFHFDTLSSLRRQKTWLLCPERRHLLFVMQTSAFWFGFVFSGIR